MPDPIPSPPPADGNNPPANPPASPTPPAVDVNTAIAQAIATKDAANAAAFKEATGFNSLQEFTEHKLKSEGKTQELLTAKEAEANKYKTQFQKTAVQNALMLASSEALKPEQIVKMLSGDCVVDDNGNVTINGKPAKDAVAEFLKDNPNLAKPSGNQGSGAPHNLGTPSADVSKMTAAQKMVAGRKSGAK